MTALVIRGTAYHALKKHDLAKKDFDDAIEHDPNEAAAYAGRGQAAIKQAAIFCDGITSSYGKSIRLARCAGAMVRYGARE